MNEDGNKVGTFSNTKRQHIRIISNCVVLTPITANHINEGFKWGICVLFRHNSQCKLRKKTIMDSPSCRLMAIILRFSFLIVAGGIIQG